jgi:hypothetical protein
MQFEPTSIAKEVSATEIATIERNGGLEIGLICIEITIRLM